MRDDKIKILEESILFLKKIKLRYLLKDNIRRQLPDMTLIWESNNEAVNFNDLPTCVDANRVCDDCIIKEISGYSCKVESPISKWIDNLSRTGFDILCERFEHMKDTMTNKRTMLRERLAAKIAYAGAKYAHHTMSPFIKQAEKDTGFHRSNYDDGDYERKKIISKIASVFDHEAKTPFQSMTDKEKQKFYKFTDMVLEVMDNVEDEFTDNN